MKPHPVDISHATRTASAQQYLTEYKTTSSEFLATVNIGVTVPPSSSYGDSTLSAAQSTTTPYSSGFNPANGTNTTLDAGHSAASICNQQRISYSLASEAWQTMVAPTTNCSTSINTYGTTEEDHAVNIDWTTFCDGHARTPATFTYPFTTKTTTLPIPVCGNATRLNSGPYPSSYPSCTIAPKECNKLYQDNLDASVATIYTPLCSTLPSFKPSCGDCTVFANGMQLFYWPVTTTSGDLCKGDGSTITAAPTGHGPNTMVVGNSTYTSPSAYYSFSDLFATAANGAMCGTAQAHFEVPVWTFDLSTISYSPINPAKTRFDAYTQSMNLADLDYPVPWSAYKGQMLCANNVSACATISSPYMPELAIPIWLTEVQDQWTTCSVLANVYDPPQALSQQAQMQLPTVPATLTTTAAVLTATPGSGIMPTQPISTTSGAIPSPSSLGTVVPVSESLMDPAASVTTSAQSGIAPASRSEDLPAGSFTTMTSSPASAVSIASVSGTPAGGAETSLSDPIVTVRSFTLSADQTGGSPSTTVVVVAQTTGSMTDASTYSRPPGIVATIIISGGEAINPGATGVASAILQIFSVSQSVQPVSEHTMSNAVAVLLSALSAVTTSASGLGVSQSSSSEMDPQQTSMIKQSIEPLKSSGAVSQSTWQFPSGMMLPSVVQPSGFSDSIPLQQAASETASTMDQTRSLQTRHSLSSLTPFTESTVPTHRASTTSTSQASAPASSDSMTGVSATFPTSSLTTSASSMGSSKTTSWDSMFTACLMVLASLFSYLR